MENKIDFFESGDYKFITNMISEKIDILKQSKSFSEKYTNLYDLIDELDVILDEEQKKKFNKVMELIYGTEEYYFALAYSLGIKYGRDIEKMWFIKS